MTTVTNGGNCDYDSDSSVSTDTDNGQDSNTDMVDMIDDVTRRRRQFSNKRAWQKKSLSESTESTISEGSQTGKSMQNEGVESSKSIVESNDDYEIKATQRKSSVLTSERDEDGDHILDPFGKPVNITSLANHSSSETGPDSIDADAISVSSVSENGDGLVSILYLFTKINYCFLQLD